MNATPLNQSELEVLKILWERGELKPAEIQAGFSRPIENATLRSVLVNLVAKGHAARKLRGKAFFYRARASKNALLQSMLRTMASVFADGSSQELVAQLVETGDIKPEDLEIIRRAAMSKSVHKPRVNNDESVA